MAETTFTAKDGNGTNFTLAAHVNADDGAYYPISMPTTRPIISQFLDTSGDGTGTINAVGDYSAATTDFYVQPPVGELWAISRLLVEVRVTGNLRAEYYDAVSALANGVRIIHKENGVEYDLTSQAPVKMLAEWGSYCYDVNPIEIGAGDNFYVVRFSFFRSGSFLNLDGPNADRLIIRLSDNMTNMNAHRFLVQGFKIQGDA